MRTRFVVSGLVRRAVLAGGVALAMAPMAAAAQQAACVPSLYVGCVVQGRFSVEVAWHNQFNGTSGRGVVVQAASTDQTLAFSFGDPANIELLVKILDFVDIEKLFYGELTDLLFQITVTDTARGTVKVYTNTPGDCGAIDESAFPRQDTAAEPVVVRHRRPVGGPPPGAGASCQPDATTLCLLDGRFAASVSWLNQYNGTLGVGTAGPLSNLTGTFYFTDPGNKELLVKMIDFGSRIAVFYGSLSDLQYTLQVTDVGTGSTKTYFNPPGTYCGGLDNFFPTDLVVSTSFTLIPVDVANAEHRTDDIALVPFTTTAGGDLEIDADWQSAADNVQLVLFGGDCTLPLAIANQCDKNQIAAARGLVKPQQLVQPKLAPGTYTIMVINFGPGNESGTMTAKFK